MTGQTILNLMEALLPELQLQAGEANVTQGLLVLNAAQDYFESRAALYPGFSGDTSSTVATTANTETTTFPAGLLRLDKIQYIDAGTSLPAGDLLFLRSTGSHLPALAWPWRLYLVTSVSGGRPTAYWTNGRSIYWSPRPDAVYTMRWYGLQAASDITAAGTFAYADAVALPLASFAVSILKAGLEDDFSGTGKLAEALFDPLIRTLSNSVRDGAAGYEYRYDHTT